MKRSICWYVIFGLLALQTLAHAQDTATGNVLFILDASGSMWGQVDQKAEIAIAKEVMTTLVQDLPEGIRAGLEVLRPPLQGRLQ
ncbi:MAG: hypothetical protein HC808_11400 [Candidatus Competibacteraceae bacterium]|nr:hypothetical protein [Candidatus Competibacteraceae bacterium]